jgi:hypothetical protein
VSVQNGDVSEHVDPVVQMLDLLLDRDGVSERSSSLPSKAQRGLALKSKVQPNARSGGLPASTADSGLRDHVLGGEERELAAGMSPRPVATASTGSASAPRVRDPAWHARDTSDKL